MEITFEQLPKAVNQLNEKVDAITRLLIDNIFELKPEPDRWFDLSELCEYLPNKPTKATVYGWIQDQKVPYHKGIGQKKLHFLKSEIDSWLKLGKRKTFVETAAEANSYLINHKNGLNHGK